MSVLRWKFTDPHSEDTYTFPRNPAEMTSPYLDRAIQSMGTVQGRVLLFEGSRGAKQWTFSGPLLDKDHFDALHGWVYDRPGRVVIDDHFGRHLDSVLLGLDVVPKRRIGYYYSHDYTITVLTVNITAPTVPNSGPA